MTRRNEFLDILLRGSGPSVELLGAFALGLLMVGILSNLAYDLLVWPQNALALIVRAVLVSLLLTAGAYLLYWDDRRRRRSVQADVDESRLAPAHAGLIWLFGPGRFDHLLFALEHHLKGGGGGHCWLVMQDTEKVQQAFSALAQELVTRSMPTRLHPCYVDKLEVQATYQAVRSILDREAREEGIDSTKVIADITGGTKPMTAGMVLAALTVGRPMEYVESERDAEGNPMPNTLRVVLTDAAFYLEREKPAGA